MLESQSDVKIFRHFFAMVDFFCVEICVEFCIYNHCRLVR